MSDIPPKQPVNGTASARVQSAYGLPPLPEAEQPPDIDATGALVSLHHAATQSGPDSFPVLKAFQDYLDSERRRASRRVALVTSLFAGIVVIVIGVFLTAGIVMFGYMKEIQDNLWRKLEVQTAAAAVPTPAVSTEGTAALVAAEDLKKLNEALADLKRDNESLRGQFAARQTPPVKEQSPATPLMAPVEVQAPPVAAPVAPAVAVKPAPVPPPVAVAAAPRLSTLVIPKGVKAPPPPAGYAESGIYLQPGGQGAPIPWRVFMPVP